MNLVMSNSMKQRNTGAFSEKIVGSVMLNLTLKKKPKGF